MSWVATAIVSSAVINGIASNSAANKQVEASQDANKFAKKQFWLNREDTKTQRKVGDAALNRMNNAQSGDFSDFFTSPGYGFVRDEGTRDIGNSFAARGSGGNAMRALAEFNSGLASQEFGNYYNRDATLAGFGNSGITTSANVGSNTAANVSNNSANISNNLIGAGNARASGIQGQNDAIQGTLANGLRIYEDYKKGKSPPPAKIPA